MSEGKPFFTTAKKIWRVNACFFNLSDESASLRHVVILVTLTVLIRYQHRWSHLQTMSVGIKILRQLFCLTEISTTPPIIASLVQ